MKELLQQIETAVTSGSYLLSLYVALALPDICGALESTNGRATGNRYKAWFNKWVSPKYEGSLTGEQCYAYRCGVLHQGRSRHEKLGYTRIIFLEPSVNRKFHRNIINDAFNIDLKIFCEDITQSVREWHNYVKDNVHFKENYSHFMKRYSNGIPPYIVGIPVIG
jgi:hypothetical protein